MKARLLSALIGVAGPLLLQVLTGLTDQKTLNQLISIANAKILDLEGFESMPGEAKRKEALRAIKQEMVAKGLWAQTVVVNLVLELALAGLRSKVR